MNKTLVTLLLAVCHAVAAMALVGESLLLPGDYPDPSIVRDGDDYYMTHSPFCYMPLDRLAPLGATVPCATRNQWRLVGS